MALTLTTPDALERLIRTPHRLRNICVLAHVDHGKTSLSDCLIASNGIVSEKLAGKVRYMDSTKDEQVRGITMKSSSILLLHRDLPYRRLKPTADAVAPAAADPTAPPPPPPDAPAHVVYAVNLIDSPGHIDFSSDVSTAVRLCDGALVVIDVLEGMCSQTRAVLHHAWSEGVRPCLVFNKMDRLVQELQLTPMDAYHRLSRLLEQVNVLASEHFASKLYAEEDSGRDTAAGRSGAGAGAGSGAAVATDHQLNPDDADDSAIFFSPSKGNVVFASAIDGWAFSLDTFAERLAPRLNVPRSVLRKALWGEWYWKKSGKIGGPAAAGKATEPMFVTHVLARVWRVYNALSADGYDEARVPKMLSALAVTVPPRELAGDVRSRTAAVFRAWLPLPKTVLSMVVRALPSPQEAQESRLPMLCPPLAAGAIPPAARPLRDALAACDAADTAPVVAFVSKTFAVPLDALPDSSRPVDSDGSSTGEAFMAFARVFSGTLRPDTPVYVLGPKYKSPLLSPEPPGVAGAGGAADATPHLSRPAGPLSLFVMMGRELGPLPCAPAGSVVGILGLSDVVVKTATLSSTPDCPSLSRMPFQTTPLVRVAIEPTSPADLRQLEAGLQLLNRADPCVEVVMTESGETHLLALGELHLERCLRELKERFARVDVVASPPILSFFETCVEPTAAVAPPPPDPVTGDVPPPPLSGRGTWTDSAGTVHALSADKSVEVVTRCLPLPEAVTRVLEQHAPVLKALTAATPSGTPRVASVTFRDALRSAMEGVGPEWAARFNNIWAFGPRQTGPNLLVSSVSGLPSLWHDKALTEDPVPPVGDGDVPGAVMSRTHKTPLVSGFQLAVQAGPMCAEPMWGVCVEVAAMPRATAGSSEDGRTAVSLGALSGQVMSCTKDACLAAFEGAAMRLVEPLYACELRCSMEAIGKLHSVLDRRRGKIVDDHLISGTSTFLVSAYLPVAESFGFANDLRKSTSGAATSPQLVFHHWEVLAVDPFFRPKTEEEREEFGDVVHEGQRANIAKAYVDQVRRRKGLVLDRKIVVHAEKQRNLSRKK